MNSTEHTTWEVEWVAMGGYDCMTDAWKVIGPKGRIYIDCADFGQKTCEYESEESQQAIQAAREFAEYIKNALNSYHPL